MRSSILVTLLFISAIAEANSKAKELAAIHTQEQSIQKLKKFLASHPGDSREPDFLIRLADLYFEKSGISFQYTEGESIKTQNKLYTNSLTQAASVLSDVIRKHPSHVSIPDAYFKRGKGYKELKKIELSKADYLKLLTIAPSYYRLDSALMDLADYAQEANHHEEALKHLLQIEKNETSQYFTVALHKAAWSYFNLNQFSNAISYLKKEILTEQSRKGELPFLESAYQDLALFYFEAINKKSGFANVEDAVKLFHELSLNQKDTQNRPFFGILLNRFSKLLKAYQLTNELHQLKSLLMKQHPQLPETMEIAMLIYEYHFDKHEYTQLVSLLSDANHIRSNLNQPTVDVKFEKSISQSLSELHKLVMKNKLSTELHQLLKPLTELTDFLQQHLSMSNPTAILAVYAMAETSFAINRYPMATKYYTELLKSGVVLPSNLTRSQLLLRLVSSRFQELKNLNKISEKLAIHKIDAPLNHLKAEEKTMIEEWLTWVFDAETTKNIDTFSFQLEAYKLMYGYLDRTESLKGMEKFALQNSSSDEAKVAASIVLDTRVISQDWKQAFELSQRLLTKKNWNDAKFIEKIQDLAADSHLKLTLASSDSSEVLTRTKECIRQFKNKKILLQCKLIQAKTWVGLKQYNESEFALSELTKANLSDDDLKTVTLMKAEVHQKQGKLGLSAQELERYLEMTGNQDGEMAKHIIQIHWFQRNFKKVLPLINNAKLCASIKTDFCEQYQAALQLIQPTSTSNYLKYFKQTTKAPKNSISFWAMAALENPTKLPFQDRLVLLQRLSNNWENMDPFLQIQFLDLMKNRVNSTVESVRKSSSSIAPLLSADEASIERRIRLMQDLDQTFAKVMKLNWIEIKLKTVNELQLVYQQLAIDLKKIGTPENLIEPFIKKQNQIADAARQLLEMSYHPKESATKISLLDSEVKEKIPSTHWEEWSNAVKNQKPDYLYYLISLRAQDEFSPLLRGLVLTSLLKDSAATEGFEMIKSAPSTPWKESIALRVSP